MRLMKGITGHAPDRTGTIAVDVKAEVDSAANNRTRSFGRLPAGEVETTLFR